MELEGLWKVLERFKLVLDVFIAIRDVVIGRGRFSQAKRDLVDEFLNEIIEQTPPGKRATREDAISQLDRLSQDGVRLKIRKPVGSSIRIKIEEERRQWEQEHHPKHIVYIERHYLELEKIIEK